MENKIYKKHVFVCTAGKTCAAQGGEEVCSALRELVAEKGLKNKIRINKAGCLDQCGYGPMIVVYPESIWYAHVDPKDAKDIFKKHLLKGKPVKKLLYKKKK